MFQDAPECTDFEFLMRVFTPRRSGRQPFDFCCYLLFSSSDMTFSHRHRFTLRLDNSPGRLLHFHTTLICTRVPPQYIVFSPIYSRGISSNIRYVRDGLDFTVNRTGAPFVVDISTESFATIFSVLRPFYLARTSHMFCSFGDMP